MQRFQFSTNFVEELQEVASAALDELDPFTLVYCQLERGPLGAHYLGVAPADSEGPQSADVARPRTASAAPLFQLSHEKAERSLHIRGASPRSGVSIFAIASREPLRLNGCDVGRGDLLVVRPGEELDFVTPPGLEFFHCHLSPHTATRISEQVDANFGATRIVRQRGELWSAFGASVRAWLEEPDPNSLTGSPRPSTRTRSMLESVTQVLADPEPEVSRPGRAPAGNTRVAQAARDLMAETQAEPVTTSELCGALGVSKRTLETAFRHRFGLSPIAYHHRLRMHAARRDLIRAQPGEVQVGAIALRHGFEHLGRFSVDYKALFAESPSRTLSR